MKNTEKGWRELLVDTAIDNPDSTAKTPFHLTRAKDSSLLAQKLPDSDLRTKSLAQGSRIEVCYEAQDVMKSLFELTVPIKENDKKDIPRGAILVIDYGSSETIPVDSLRAIKDHAIVSPFQEPGRADLSADVDFGRFKQLAVQNGCIEAWGPITQGEWLHKLGIRERALRLATQLNDAKAQEMVFKAYKRLAGDGLKDMGKSYKVMAFTAKGSNAPVGFGGIVQ